jgi:hypothetical protein
LKTVKSTKAITNQTATLENQGLFNADSSQSKLEKYEIQLVAILGFSS